MNTWSVQTVKILGTYHFAVKLPLSKQVMNNHFCLFYSLLKSFTQWVMSKKLWLLLAKIQPLFVKNKPKLAKILAKFGKNFKIVQNFA